VKAAGQSPAAYAGHASTRQQRLRRPTHRDPWGAGWDTAHKFGYPLTPRSPLEELELDVAELRRDLDLAIGLALVDDVR